MGTVVCESCGDQVDNTYDCRDCGDGYCIDCRLPADHECPEHEQEGSTEQRTGDPLEGLDLNIPTGPRVDVFLPVWRLLPWQAHVTITYLLAPLSPLLLAVHAYHDRMDVGDDEWLPSRLYYLPLPLFLIFKGVLTMGPIITVVFAVLFGYIGTTIYAIQKSRH